MDSHREIRMLHALDKIAENLDLIGQILSKRYPLFATPDWAEPGVTINDGDTGEVVGYVVKDKEA